MVRTKEGYNKNKREKSSLEKNAFKVFKLVSGGLTDKAVHTLREIGFGSCAHST